MSVTKEDVDIREMYEEQSTLSKDEFIKKYNIVKEGLSNTEVNNARKEYGLNEVKQAKPKKWYNYLFEGLFTPFNCILLVIAIILCYTDVYLPKSPSYANIIVIIILVLASTLLDFFEEYRSNKAAEKLKAMVATTTTVIRNGKKIQIPIKDVVIGDTVILFAGSMIPADIRIVDAKDLYVGQSTLTGESEGIKKTVELESRKNVIDDISDLDNICFMGTNVISGTAIGVVIKTGDDTYFGKIAHTVTNGKEKTDFQKGIENISKLLIKFMLIIVPVIFLINVEKHDIILAFTFAVAIAICITPLLLPVILSSSLSKGAVRMSKKKTIVKKLDSIENFGAMNILCTDKTGTLTEDKIVLEKYLDIKGNEDIGALKYAFINAYFQTGLKDSIDEAIIKRASENDLLEYTVGYKVIDEIPFDFSRRCLSVVVDDGKKRQLITKGAVEEILDICTKVEYKGRVSKITKEIKDNIKKISKELNEEGLRVIAICKRMDIDNINKFSTSDEQNMTLVGFIGFLDPPKVSAKASIIRLNNAGIRVIVLTGDNLEVTKCICKKVGINSENIVLGNELDKLSDIAVYRLLKNTNIFAKVSPIQKARIVSILREHNNVVGYIGDGINDSPSLINSDVGISVDTAVDIAKESADIILLQKDLNVLLEGVSERKTYICKFNEIYKDGD